MSALESNIVEKVANLEVFDSSGTKIKFGNVFASKKAIVVFIRHFFCGSCQAYVEQLSKVPQEALNKAETEVVIVGCGDHKGISYYATKTGFSGKIYAEPSRELYHALGMNIENLNLTPAEQEQRSYLKDAGGIGKRSVVGALEILKNPSLIGKQGKLDQLGGDFVFGPGNQCSYAHLMQHTEDHIEVKELMEQAGVVF